MISRLLSRLGWGLAIFAVELFVGFAEWLERRRARREAEACRRLWDEDASRDAQGY